MRQAAELTVPASGVEVYRVHGMPFGAQMCAGGVHFRLWAPAARDVDLILLSLPEAAVRPMVSVGGGWFERFDTAAHDGTEYQFLIDKTLTVPDPAARRIVNDVSIVIDPVRFEWHDVEWRTPPWNESVLYELHVGTYTPEGTFQALIPKLDHLLSLGVTMIELMPIGHFPGRRGWGYDGVLPFAPAEIYGTPGDFKRFVEAAHQRGIGVLLDVVYNHFGPEGNYLGTYAPSFFSKRHSTPWGAAINFDGERSRTVRQFFIQNALYWLTEYNLDGLRLDAVHAIRDEGTPHFLTELAREVRTRFGDERAVHLVLENERNESGFLSSGHPPERFDAQWNDDVHHCLHVILTEENNSVLGDFADDPHLRLAQGLAEGFAYQGTHSTHHGKPRGEPSKHLAPTSFVNFLQNHDQIGNRAIGERLTRLVKVEAPLRAAYAVLLLSPAVPMLFMGEEWAAPEPFLYFCDYGPALAETIREGRQREFAALQAAGARNVGLPDPCAEVTFTRSQLDWRALEREPHARWLKLCTSLLTRRRERILPLIPSIRDAGFDASARGPIRVAWRLADGGALRLVANLRDVACQPEAPLSGEEIYSTHADTALLELPPWFVRWAIDRS